LCLAFIAFIALPQPATAQNSGSADTLPSAIGMPGSNYTVRPYYDVLVREIMTEQPRFFNFGYLRQRYTEIAEYDPLGDKARDEILKRAYVMENSQDRAAVKNATEEYDALVRTHLGNLGVVAQVLALAKQNKLFGDAALFERIRNGLFDDVLNSGDGETLIGAYDVFVLAEEVMLLSELKVDVVHTGARESGGTYYNMHSVVDRKTGRPYTIFVDVTKPMRYLEYLRREKKNNLDIRKQ
jgi:hypothetical protein